MMKHEVDTTRKDLAHTRERLADLAGRLSHADTAAHEAFGPAEAAKLAAALAPEDRGAAQAVARTAGKLDAAIRDRDTIEEQIAVLRKHEARLAEALAEADKLSLAERQAQAREELARSTAAGRAAAKEWAVRALAGEMVRGVHVTDPGLALIQALAPDRHASEAAVDLSEAAITITEKIGRGEAP